MEPTAPTSRVVRDDWDRPAVGSGGLATPGSMELGTAALRRLDPGPGTRLLDVAAGSGALSIPAARLGADVVAVDLAPTMLERLAARARTEGLTGVETRVMDGRALDLDDGAFDLTVSMNGVSLFDDLDAGLREMVRVTRPGGRILLVTLGPPERAEFLAWSLGALRAVVPELTLPPLDPPPLPFQAADPAILEARLTAAGAIDTCVETAVWRMRFGSAKHLWNLVTHSSPLGARLAAELTDGQSAEVLRVLEGMLRERSGGEPGAVLTTATNIATATKPTRGQGGRR